MAVQREARLVARIMRAARRSYPEAWMMKVHGGPFQMAGVPDIIGVLRGRMLAMEVKHPDTSHGVTPLQEEQMRRMAEAGATVRVVESVEEALDVMREVDHM